MIIALYNPMQVFFKVASKIKKLLFLKLNKLHHSFHSELLRSLNVIFKLSVVPYIPDMIFLAP